MISDPLANIATQITEPVCPVFENTIIRSKVKTNDLMDAYHNDFFIEEKHNTNCNKCLFIFIIVYSTCQGLNTLPIHTIPNFDRAILRG